MRVSFLALAGMMASAVAGPVGAQEVDAIPSDVESAQAIVLAAYAAIAREPGKDYDWERFRTLFLDGALHSGSQQIAYASWGPGGCGVKGWERRRGQDVLHA